MATATTASASPAPVPTYTGPSVPTMVADHSLAREIMARHPTRRARWRATGSTRWWPLRAWFARGGGRTDDEEEAAADQKIAKAAQ
ncbi:hypothetical protein SPI_07929 [Niveomyces insectorum RCEF 264]|uniref:Uncharacterized protein n=1 Tax=Niveomyces insectorum RCEF 264 TaxID=1081102 RepID=A0A167P5N1_9HYPO|nr:hypothetical protein SPI_07929 [Niveomyces insectorum RCEF 264]